MERGVGCEMRVRGVEVFSDIVFQKISAPQTSCGKSKRIKDNPACPAVAASLPTIKRPQPESQIQHVLKLTACAKAEGLNLPPTPTKPGIRCR
jgi:hypothetical protein